MYNACSAYIIWQCCHILAVMLYHNSMEKVLQRNMSVVKHVTIARIFYYKVKFDSTLINNYNIMTCDMLRIIITLSLTSFMINNMWQCKSYSNVQLIK